MDEKLVKKKIEELSIEYDFSISRINTYYRFLKGIPIIIEDDDQEKLLECLEMIVQDRITQRFDGFERKRKLEDSIYDAIYRTYEDRSIPYLSESYKKMNELYEYNDNPHVLQKKMERGYVQNVYDGYSS